MRKKSELAAFDQGTLYGLRIAASAINEAMQYEEGRIAGKKVSGVRKR